MIDPATSWFEMVEIHNKTPMEMANIVEMTWLNRYPRPSIVTFDGGPEFKADFKEVMKEEFNLEVKPTTVRNPQANAILERVHQTIGNMIRTFQVYNRDDLDEEDPWSGILSAVMFAMRSTYHTTLEATPMQLVFGRDAVLPIFHQADWQYIKAKKQRLINMNNQRENAKRIPHTYQVNDKVLFERIKKTKYGEKEYDGPFTILAVHDNGTAQIQKQNYSDVVNIRRLKPYYD